MMQMARLKYIAAALLVGAIFGATALYWRGRDERLVRKTFRQLAELVSKETGENPLAGAVRSGKIGSMFTDGCAIVAPEASLSGTYSAREVSEAAMRGRSFFSSLTLRLYDLDVSLAGGTEAVVGLSVRLRGSFATGGRMDEAHEFSCTLRKISGDWLFVRAEKVEVLKK